MDLAAPSGLSPPSIRLAGDAVVVTVKPKAVAGVAAIRRLCRPRWVVRARQHGIGNVAFLEGREGPVLADSVEKGGEPDLPSIFGNDVADNQEYQE
jgi:hypothetical protein